MAVCLVHTRTGEVGLWHIQVLMALVLVLVLMRVLLVLRVLLVCLRFGWGRRRRCFGDWRGPQLVLEKVLNVHAGWDGLWWWWWCASCLVWTCQWRAKRSKRMQREERRREEKRGEERRREEKRREGDKRPCVSEERQVEDGW